MGLSEETMKFFDEMVNNNRAVFGDLREETKQLKEKYCEFFEGDCRCCPAGWSDRDGTACHLKVTANRWI